MLIFGHSSSIRRSAYYPYLMALPRCDAFQTIPSSQSKEELESILKGSPFLQEVLAEKDIMWHMSELLRKSFDAAAQGAKINKSALQVFSLQEFTRAYYVHRTRVWSLHETERKIGGDPHA